MNCIALVSALAPSRLGGEKDRRRLARVSKAALALAVAWTTAATAQSPLATYDGPDRMERIVDARMMLDEYEKWTKLYEEIFAAKSR